MCNGSFSYGNISELRSWSLGQCWAQRLIHIQGTHTKVLELPWMISSTTHSPPTHFHIGLPSLLRTTSPHVALSTGPVVGPGDHGWYRRALWSPGATDPHRPALLRGSPPEPCQGSSVHSKATAQPSPALAESTGVLRGPQKAVTRMGEEGWGPEEWGCKRRGGRPDLPTRSCSSYFPALQPWAKLLSEAPSHICGKGSKWVLEHVGQEA